MTPRGNATGTKPFPAAEARRRPAFTRRAHTSGDLIAAEGDLDARQVAIGLYVLAGIASADVICGQLVNQRWRGHDHGGAGRFLRQSASNDRRLDAERLQSHLMTLTTMKDLAHYSTEIVTSAATRKAARASAALFAAAEVVSRD